MYLHYAWTTLNPLRVDGGFSGDDSYKNHRLEPLPTCKEFMSEHKHASWGLRLMFGSLRPSAFLQHHPLHFSCFIVPKCDISVGLVARCDVMLKIKSQQNMKVTTGKRVFSRLPPHECVRESQIYPVAKSPLEMLCTNLQLLNQTPSLPRKMQET